MVVSRIVDRGVPCIVDAGNDGNQGLFYPSTPAIAKGAVAVASYETVTTPVISYHCITGPATGCGGGGDDDVGAVLKGLVEGRDQEVRRGGATAAKDSVRAELHAGRGSGEAQRVFLRGQNAGEMSSVTAAIFGILAGHGLVVAREGIANQVGPEGHEAVRLSEASVPEGRVRVVNARVNHGNLEAIAGQALGTELVHLRHDVRRESIGGPRA